MNSNDIIHIIWLLWVFIGFLFLLLSEDYRKSHYMQNNLFEMKYPKGLGYFFIFLFSSAFVFFGILFILSNFKKLQDILVCISIEGLFLTLIVLSYLYFFKKKIVITNSYIQSSSPFVKPIIIKWDEVSSIKCSKNKNSFIVETGTANRIVINCDLTGINVFLASIRRYLSPNIYKSAEPQLIHYINLRKNFR